MTPEAVQEAAQALISARRNQEAIPGLPESCQPANAAEGLEIQAAALAESGEVPAGYKIGATSVRAQKALQVSEPFSGRLLQSKIFNSPANLLGAAFIFRLLEPEFAFRMGATLAPREAPYREAEMAAAVASAHPSFEVVTSGLENWMGQGAPSMIADNGVHGALVLGPGTEDWQKLDLPGLEVILTVNGSERSRGRGENALGGPLTALTWLANHLSQRNIALQAGEIVTTGVVTEFLELQVGDEASADYGPLGTISLVIS